MRAELKSFGTLFSETWDLFKNRALTILAVMLVSTLVVVGVMIVTGVLAALSVGGMQAALEQVQLGQINMQILLLSCAVIFVVMLAAMWSQSALFAVVVGDNMGVRESLWVGWQRLRSMGWILLLAGSIVMIGFLLFIVPGIIFSVSLMFALYPLYDEDQRGMDALIASRRYVKGRWWNTFGKLLLIWLIALVLDLIPLIGPFLSFVFIPFLFLFVVAMYRNLKETAGEAAGEERRFGLWLLALVGMLLPLVGLFAALVSLGPQLPAVLQELGGAGDPPSIPGGIPNVEPGLPGPEDSIVQDIPVIPGAGQGIWRDPVGDVDELGVGRWMDIETVSIKADAGTLLIDIQTSFPLSVSFNAISTMGQSFYRLAVFYFDIDVNRQTGGTAGEVAGRSGYEFGLDLTLEAPRNEPDKGQVHVGLLRFDNGARSFLGPLPEDNVQVQGNRIRLRLPYDVLGVQAGNRIRLSFIESFQKQGSGLSKDKIIDL